MTLLCRRILCSDFLARPFLFMGKLFPLLATLVDACRLLFLLCRFLCSFDFLGSGRVLSGINSMTDE